MRHLLPVLLLLMTLNACQRDTAPALSWDEEETAAQVLDYPLLAGDVLDVKIYEAPELSGNYRVGTMGTIQLPLAGSVFVKGLTETQAADAIRLKLTDGYFVDPHVAVQVLSYRPVTVTGEVNRPGQYVFTPQLSLIEAIALSGGFNYRADKSDIVLIRQGREQTLSAVKTPAFSLQPGDILQVRERLF